MEIGWVWMGEWNGCRGRVGGVVGACKVFRSCFCVWVREMGGFHKAWKCMGWHGMGVSTCAERRCWIGCVVLVVGTWNMCPSPSTDTWE